MNHTEFPFPRRELTGGRHQQIRDLLVQEVAPAARRNSVRLRVIVPAAALAVVAAIGGAALVTGSWDDSLGIADPAANPDAAETPGNRPRASCGDRKRASLTLGDGLRYLRAAPVGWTYTSMITQEWVCPDNTYPVVGFVKTGEDGTIVAALTVWRSLPSNIGVDPEGVSTGTADTSVPGDSKRRNSPSSPVTVRSRSGRLIGDGKLTWVEPDGQRWSVTGSGLSVAQLTDLADDLVLSSGSATLSDSSVKGFQQLSIPQQKVSKKANWQPNWEVCYDPSDPMDCSLMVDVNRFERPWQARLTEFGESGASTRVVDVGGRPGVVVSAEPGTADSSLYTSIADGVQVHVAVEGSLPAPSNLVEFAEQLKQVAADDPLIHEPEPSKD